MLVSTDLRLKVWPIRSEMRGKTTTRLSFQHPGLVRKSLGTKLTITSIIHLSAHAILHKSAQDKTGGCSFE